MHMLIVVLDVIVVILCVYLEPEPEEIIMADKMLMKAQKIRERKIMVLL